MAPKKATIEKELAETVRRVYNSAQRDELTVNYVRQEVEKKLNLDEGFFKEGDWKAKSKEIIHETLAEVQDEAPSSQPAPPTPPSKTKAKAKPAPKPTAKSKNGAKPAPKRSKKAATPSDQSESELSEISEPTAEESDESELSEEEAPKKKRGAPAKRGPVKRKALSDDDEDEDELSSEVSDLESEEEPPKKRTKVTPKKAAPPAKKAAPKKPAPKQKAKQAKPAEVDASDAESSLLSEIPEDESDKETSEDLQVKTRKPTPKSPETKKQVKPQTSPPEDEAAGSDSEMSVVIDEPPKRNRKSKSSEPTPKTSKPKKSRGPAKTAAPLDPDQAKIKELQGQLLKCGVRKVWAFELKKYGDDVKAKVRHLKGMLEEIGMTGRFSEAKAREIKERRELMADLDAVKEGEKSWGLGGGGRLSRRRGAASGKSFKEPSDEDVEDDEEGDGKVEKEKDDRDDDAGDDDEDDEDAQPKARGPLKHRADLAFLDDESESD